MDFPVSASELLNTAAWEMHPEGLAEFKGSNFEGNVQVFRSVQNPDLLAAFTVLIIWSTKRRHASAHRFPEIKDVQETIRRAARDAVQGFQQDTELPVTPPYTLHSKAVTPATQMAVMKNLIYSANAVYDGAEIEIGE